jgi:hypothetical protein
MDNQSLPEPDTLPEELIPLVKPELQPGERLLWAARARLRPVSAVNFPITSLLTAVTTVGLCCSSFYAIFGPPRLRFLSVEGLLIGVGIVSGIVGLISGIVAFDRWMSRSRPNDYLGNAYALTDRRAIIWIPLKGSTAVEVHTFSRGSIKAIHRLEYPDGSGNVKFDYPMEEFCSVPSGFEGVSQVRYVEDLTRRTLLGPDPSIPA